MIHPNFMLRHTNLWALILVPCLTLVSPSWADQPEVTTQLLENAQDHDSMWITYGRNYGAWRHIPVDTINKENVSQLRPKWIYQTGVSGGGYEVSAITFNNLMYLTTANSHLFCVDARTGETVWSYDHPLPETVNLCCGPVNRGVAIHGNRIYYTTLDAHLICFDAATGLMLWDRVVEDYRASYSLTVAPLVVKDKVLVGIAGGEYGIRGFIDAYSLDTGELMWRRHTIPAEGEPGNDTWSGDSWKSGGAPTWVTGTYDPDLNLVYWGTGNPSPDFNGDVRMGDNLYSNSILAINPDNGEIAWYFQTSPHDIFDLDGTSEPMIIDEEINGELVKLVIQVNRNGFIYALNRTNGEFVYAKPYSKVTWANYDEYGRPVVKPELLGPGYKTVCPGIFGAKNWPPAAYSPDTHMVYLPDMQRCSTFASLDVIFRRGLPYYGGIVMFNNDDESAGYVKAVDVRTGEVKWTFETPGGPNWAGMLSTGGGLVFGGAPDGYLRAFDAETGEVLWKYQTGSGVFAPPTSFTIDGEQYIGLAAGWGQPAEALGMNKSVAGSKGGSAYLLFSLPGD